MDYSNPDIPEGINYSKTHPLKEFVILTGGIFGTLLIVVLVLGFFADHFAQYIPYSVEKDFRILVPEKDDGPPTLKAYLDALSERIVATQTLPEGMDITVHYVDSDVVNAYATLGGHVVLFRGLLEKLEHENALVMVMAHEIAHVEHRHVIRSLGSGLVVGLALSMISSSLGDTVVSSMINQTGTMGALKFSRSHEEEADSTALEVLQRLYGHAGGAEELFMAIKAEEKNNYVPEFFSTHPNTDGRIARIKELRERRAQHEFKLEPLPANFKTWLKSSPADPK